MKKSLRFASAALALTLAAGMTLPAFAAAKADYSKDETVYAVMNAVGSIKSTYFWTNNFIKHSSFSKYFTKSTCDCCP